MTLPGHALFDTGAQHGTVGLSHWHRWCICLATCYGVQPRILDQPLGHASGVGGDSKVLARCQMPTGIAGINGITTWLVLEETQENQIPALFPIDIMGDMDMVHEISDKRVNIRSYTTKEGKVSPPSWKSCLPNIRLSIFVRLDPRASQLTLISIQAVEYGRIIYLRVKPLHPTWAQIGGWMCQLLLLVRVIT